jgi:hypothetical protein
MEDTEFEKIAVNIYSQHTVANLLTITIHDLYINVICQNLHKLYNTKCTQREQAHTQDIIIIRSQISVNKSMKAMILTIENFVINKST